MLLYSCGRYLFLKTVFLDLFLFLNELVGPLQVSTKPWLKVWDLFGPLQVKRKSEMKLGGFRFLTVFEHFNQ